MYITQGLKRAVQINRNGIATIDGTRQRTWAEFAERVAKLAGVFKALDLSEGGRVAILALNSDRYLEYFFAVPWAGGIVVSLNIRLSPPELVYMLNDSGAEILIVDDAFQAMLPAFSGTLTTVKHVVVAGAGLTPAGTVNYEESLAKAPAVPDAERGGDHVAGIFYTGGTTGLAKGVMLTHDNIVSNTLNALATWIPRASPGSTCTRHRCSTLRTARPTVISPSWHAPTCLSPSSTSKRRSPPSKSTGSPP